MKFKYNIIIILILLILNINCPSQMLLIKKCKEGVELGFIMEILAENMKSNSNEQESKERDLLGKIIILLYQKKFYDKRCEKRYNKGYPML
ncbi:MAG: hypothetical protein KatS3mg002_1707 [Candidatus Woesearchaeota archaeon]|nr:MAG: hypothetical protein KatS3mg002_1707 [Candidatus Woesearchaeota archaeon]GIX42591.1 MAG: hypothetical protein KatS3mg129_2324 [Leptospiraceae bacterium]